jgi:hypothetical protein
MRLVTVQQKQLQREGTFSVHRGTGQGRLPGFALAHQAICLHGLLQHCALLASSLRHLQRDAVRGQAVLGQVSLLLHGGAVGGRVQRFAVERSCRVLGLLLAADVRNCSADSTAVIRAHNPEPAGTAKYVPTAADACAGMDSEPYAVSAGYADPSCAAANCDSIVGILPAVFRRLLPERDDGVQHRRAVSLHDWAERMPGDAVDSRRGLHGMLQPTTLHDTAHALPSFSVEQRSVWSQLQPVLFFTKGPKGLSRPIGNTLRRH